MSGFAARFTPIPIDSQSTVPALPVLSSRMPATLPPASSTSFGHLSASAASRTYMASVA
jgi:hypothetical protein